jgi:NAD(P)-dependent dehydrogenase (short-subunit alcohol dehydrogenase family)
MLESLDEKVAIVTGGGSGIGEALCLELARRGARVVVADINGDDAGRVAAAVAANGGRATASTLDVAKDQDVRRLVEETASAHGRLDYLFNNAGMVARGSRCREGGAGQALSPAAGDIIGVAMAGSCLLAGDVPVTVGANRGHE